VLDQIHAQKEELNFGGKATVDTNKLLILVEARASMDAERERFFMESARLKDELGVAKKEYDQV
jgi:hypothetical protein